MGNGCHLELRRSTGCRDHVGRTGLGVGTHQVLTFWVGRCSIAPNPVPFSVSWSTGVVHHSWLTTLAGDLGQTALLKRKGESWVGPDGYFNSTICPTEFYMRMMQGQE